MSLFESESFRADLHTHTIFSDGQDTSEVLLEKAKEAGLRGLSITDHDTIAAYQPAVWEYAKELNILLLPGVEISSKYLSEDVHILGYGFELGYEPFARFLEEIRRRRKERNRQILVKLERLGISISEQELLEIAPNVAGRPHIATLLIKKGVVADIQEAFQQYLKEGASCYVMGERFDGKEVISQIQAAKGKAILAHPHFIRRKRMLHSLLQLPFDGLECYYASFPLQVGEKWGEIAQKKKWLVTGGSDYHGGHKHIQNGLGCSWVGWNLFQQLQNPLLSTKNSFKD